MYPIFLPFSASCFFPRSSHRQMCWWKTTVHAKLKAQGPLLSPLKPHRQRKTESKLLLTQRASYCGRADWNDLISQASHLSALTTTFRATTSTWNLKDYGQWIYFLALIQISLLSNPCPFGMKGFITTL